MFDKSEMLKAVINVIKADIIPNLKDGVAREQAIAIIPILKNIDLQTQENSKPYEELVSMLSNELTSLFSELELEGLSETFITLHQDVKQLLADTNKPTIEKYQELNDLFSSLIQLIYQNKKCSHFIPRLREVIKNQVQIELSIVR